MAETNENQEIKAAAGEAPVVEQQAETNKAVRKTVKAKTKSRAAAKTKTAAASGDTIIKAASNPPRPDRKVVQKGDLLVPVEEGK